MTDRRHKGECLNCHRTTMIWQDGLCSRKCRDEYKRSRKYGICRHCGKHLPKPARGPIPEYCPGGQCRRAHQRAIRKTAARTTTKGRRGADLANRDLAERIRIRRNVRNEAKERTADAKTHIERNKATMNRRKNR